MVMSGTSSLKSTPAISGKKSPRLALVGCGAIAKEYYLPALSRHPSVMERLILVDRDGTRARALAAEFQVSHSLTDYHEALEQVDGAIIAVPTHLHYPIAMEFLCRGVHVLCEKPLAESADKARSMVEQAQKTGVTLAANYLQRLYAPFAKVKELLTERTLGEPLSIKYAVGEEFRWPTVSGFYFNSPLSSRGVLRDRGAHVLDHICWWLGGKPGLISCQNDSFGGSDAVAHVRFELNHCVGEVKLSWLGSFPCQFVVECEAGTIIGDVYDLQSLRLQTGSGERKQIRLKSGGRSKLDVACQMVTNFIRVVTTGEKPLVSGHEVLDSIEFIDECYAAATRFDMPWYEILEAHGVR
jgi:predicted dehydrogenase